MIIKLCAITIIILSFVLLGYVKTAELSFSFNNIKSLIDALNILECEIKTKNSKLYDAFNECSTIDRTGLFKEIALISESCGNYLNISNSVKEKLNNKNAVNAFISFINGLKVEDTNGQIANIRICKDRLRFVYDEIGSNIEKTKRIYFLSFVLSGVAISILFI